MDMCLAKSGVLGNLRPKALFALITRSSKDKKRGTVILGGIDLRRLTN